MSTGSALLDLALLYGQLSLLAFGGANAVLPDMQRQVVDVHHWMTAEQFAAMFALAQAAPGPNMMVVSLVGWRVAGVAGAVVSTAAVAVPSSLLTLIVSGLWYRFKDAPLRKALQAGLQPVTVGLIMAGAALLIRTTLVDLSAALVFAAAALAFIGTKLHPMLILATAAAVGAIGLVG
jgi:chromate transporter